VGDRLEELSGKNTESIERVDQLVGGLEKVSTAQGVWLTMPRSDPLSVIGALTSRGDSIARRVGSLRERHGPTQLQRRWSILTTPREARMRSSRIFFRPTAMPLCLPQAASFGSRSRLNASYLDSTSICCPLAIENWRHEPRHCV